MWSSRLSPWRKHIHAHSHTYTNSHNTHTHTHTHTHAHTHTCTHTHTHTHTHTYTHTSKVHPISGLILRNQLRIEGFEADRWLPKWPMAFKQIAQWIQEVYRCSTYVESTKYNHCDPECFQLHCKSATGGQFLAILHGTSSFTYICGQRLL